MDVDFGIFVTVVAREGSSLCAFAVSLFSMESFFKSTASFNFEKLYLLIF